MVLLDDAVQRGEGVEEFAHAVLLKELVVAVLPQKQTDASGVRLRKPDEAVVEELLHTLSHMPRVALGVQLGGRASDHVGELHQQQGRGKSRQNHGAV